MGEESNMREGMKEERKESTWKEVANGGKMEGRKRERRDVRGETMIRGRDGGEEGRKEERRE